MFFFFFFPLLLDGEERRNKYQVEEDWAGKSWGDAIKMDCRHHTKPNDTPSWPLATRVAAQGRFSAAQPCSQGSGGVLTSHRSSQKLLPLPLFQNPLP